jgi:hypothetical protein
MPAVPPVTSAVLPAIGPLWIGSMFVAPYHDSAMPRALMARELTSRDLLWRTATLLAFPLAGLAPRGPAGHADAVLTAVLAGAVAGLGSAAEGWVIRRLGRATSP